MNLVNVDFYNCSDLQQQEEYDLLFLTTSPIRIDEKIIARISNLHKIYGGTTTGYLSPFSHTTTTQSFNKGQFSFTVQSFADVFKIGVLKTFAIFTGKHLCWSIFLINNFFTKRLQHICFPMNTANFLKTSLSQNTSGGETLTQ